MCLDRDTPATRSRVQKARKMFPLFSRGKGMPNRLLSRGTPRPQSRQIVRQPNKAMSMRQGRVLRRLRSGGEAPLRIKRHGLHIGALRGDRAETWGRRLWGPGEFSERMAWPDHAPAELEF